VVSKNAKLLVVLVLLMGLLATGGCKFSFNQLLQKTQKQEAELIKAEIHFTSNDYTVGYVKSLGVEEDGEIYIGGASVNYIYDQKGKVVGSFNYARVEYIKIIK